MTTLSLAGQPDACAAPRPLPWRQLAWVTWRQHRATLITVPALFTAAAIFLVIAGLKVHHDYAAVLTCTPAQSGACLHLNSSFNSTDWVMGNSALILLNLAPALIGAFAGAPMLARELESGTYLFAWTQGFSRGRQTVAKLVFLAVVLTAVAGAFTSLFSWFFQPFLPQENLTLLSATVFDTHGTAFAAWVLTAFTLSALMGMLLRRVVPALAVSLGAYVALAVVTWLAVRQTYPVGGFWARQALESGALLVLSVLLATATVRLVRRRAA